MALPQDLWVIISRYRREESRLRAPDFRAHDAEPMECRGSSARKSGGCIALRVPAVRYASCGRKRRGGATFSLSEDGRSVHPARRVLQTRLSQPPQTTPTSKMQLKTILNRVHKHPLFVYGAVEFVEHGDQLTLEVQVRPRANGQGLSAKDGMKWVTALKFRMLYGGASPKPPPHCRTRQTLTY